MVRHIFFVGIDYSGIDCFVDMNWVFLTIWFYFVNNVAIW